MPRDHSPLRIGLFSIGLDAYWPQFPGLKEKLLAFNQTIERRLVRHGVEVVNLELVDSPEKAVSAGHRFRETDVDVIFLHGCMWPLMLFRRQYSQ